MPEIKKYLNRDGLEEYNSLLPHSSAEMQTYVNEWMDEHPEATTTVQDGAITELKLADKSVSLRTLADDTVHMLKGAILTGNLSGEVLTADDAYSAPPVSLTVEGKSTQDGTPTPDAPVEIVSVEQVNLGFYGRNLLDPSTLSNGYIIADGTVYGSLATYKHNDYLRVLSGVTYRISQGGTAFNAIGTAFYDEDKQFISSGRQNNLVSVTFTAPANAAYMRSSFNGAQANEAMIEIDHGAYDGFVPYVGQSVLLNLTQALRSLPNGTHDALSFAYLRPSTREGWAWYTPTMVQRVGSTTYQDGGFTGVNSSGGYKGFTRTKPSEVAYTGSISVPYVSNRFARANTQANNTIYNYRAQLCCVTEDASIVPSGLTTEGLAEFNEWNLTNPIVVDYLLQTPTTTTFDPIELPVLPAPTCTVWAYPSTGLHMEYVRDSNIVIQNIEQAIADS